MRDTMTEDQISAINLWLESNPGVYVTRDPATCWASAHKASGVECDLKSFRSQCRRVGIDARPHGDGFLLDFSHGRDLLLLGIE